MLQELQSAPKITFSVSDAAESKSDYLEFKRGQLIYCEGSTPLGVYFVRKGKVKMSKMGSDGKEQILRIVTPEEMLSCSDLISDSRYSTSAKALEDTTLLFIPKLEFWKMLRQEQKVLEQFVLLLSSDLKMAETKIADLAYKPVRGRLADALIFLSEKYNHDNKKNDKIKVSIKRSDLASFVGTAKETVNRLLSEFRSENIIETDGHDIAIVNMQKLNHLCGLYN